jgi:biopolymer transport protein ExbD
MSLSKKKRKVEINLNLVPMIDVTSFILLALGILVMSMKKEASLDNVLKLPMVSRADKQDTTQLQIYVLQASLLPGGYVNPDSTGLVAFMGRASIPAKCPSDWFQFRDEKTGDYIPNSLLDASGKPIASLQSSGKQTEEEAQRASSDRPPAYKCAQCGLEISPYVRLDEVPGLLKKEKEKVAMEFVVNEKKNYLKIHGVEMPPEMAKEREDSMKKTLPLMIKADNEAFYGRILQVVNVARDTTCDIRKFAFITSAEAAEQAQKAAKDARAAAGK